MDLFRELLNKAQNASQGGFKEVWELYKFLDENDGLSIYVAVGNRLEELSPTLTEDQKAEMRERGCLFQEDLENVPEWVQQGLLPVGYPPRCKGCGTHHWPYEDCFHNGIS